MGTHTEHGQTGQPEPGAGEKSSSSESRVQSAESSPQSPGSAVTHHDDGEARSMRTFQSFKHIFITYTGAFIASFPVSCSNLKIIFRS